jgi:L-alanine-DL-glutamate epimerase-like enolase superfamily enzyme
MSKLRITKIEVHEFTFSMHDVGKDYNGFNLVYEPGGQQTGTSYATKVFTNEGVTGEYIGDDSPSFAEFSMFAGYLIGKDPIQRELVYNDVERAMRKFDKMGMGQIDIVLWDLAGKYYDAPVFKMLGGWRTSLPCYASTMHGDRNGGLDSPSVLRVRGGLQRDGLQGASRSIAGATTTSTRRSRPSTPYATPSDPRWT